MIGHHRVECVLDDEHSWVMCACTGFRIKDRDQINHVWRTCCALHNLLLEKDDFAGHWEGGVAHPEEGDFDEDDVPDVFARLAQHNRGVPDNDLSGISRDRVAAADADASYDAFRSTLVEHFEYRWARPPGHADAVVWPRRNGPGAAGVANADHKAQ